MDRFADAPSNTYLREGLEETGAANIALRTVRKEVADSDDILQFTSRKEPTPEEALIFTEQIEQLVDGLPDIYRDMIRLRIAGCTTREIGDQLNVSRQTVSRALALLRQRLSESTATADAADPTSKKCDETGVDRNVRD